jgi:LEM3 (ligand-effect modulator 3) family / CDC50 family
VASRSSDQLQGKAADRTKAEKDCSTKVFSNTSQLLYPCGLIANSFFTDTITLITPTLTMKQTDIAWPSDKVKYQQITGFQKSSEVTCGTTSCAPLPSNCKSYTDITTGKCYMYYYPDDDKVQYLYETYPNIISPLKGVTDEHFMVWMRTAALPTFRKPYGVVAGPFKKGDVLLFTVNPLYEVKSFGGTKTLVISTVGQFGGKNIYLGAGYVVVGGLSFLLSFMFVVKSQLNSRAIGDPSLLTWSS